MVPAKGRPKKLKLKSSWHPRRQSKILAVSLKHWKGRSGGGGGRGRGVQGGGAPTVYGCSNTSLGGGGCKLHSTDRAEAGLEATSIRQQEGRLTWSYTYVYWDRQCVQRNVRSPLSCETPQLSPKDLCVQGLGVREALTSPSAHDVPVGQKTRQVLSGGDVCLACARHATFVSQ